VREGAVQKRRSITSTQRVTRKGQEAVAGKSVLVKKKNCPADLQKTVAQLAAKARENPSICPAETGAKEKAERH